jgi:hypothetical protein
MRGRGVEFLSFEPARETLASRSLSETRPLPHWVGGTEMVAVPFLDHRPVAGKYPAAITLQLLATKAGDTKCGN